LYSKYESDGLRIAAFPCNQFAGQEPGTEAEIKKFATDKFGVTFDMYSKIDVNGSGAHPIYKYLKMKKSGMLIDAIKWNFSKFTIGRDGQPVERYAPNVEPNAMEDDLVKLLGVPKK